MKCDKATPLPLPAAAPPPTPVAAPAAPAVGVNNHKTIIQAVVIAVVVTLALIGAGWFAWSQYTDHVNGQKTREVSAQIKDSMQTKFSSDADLSNYGVTVLSVDLIRVTDTKYEGMATVRTGKSSLEHQVKIDVTADGEHTMWQAAPGAMMFLFQEGLSTQPSTTP